MRPRRAHDEKRVWWSRVSPSYPHRAASPASAPRPEEISPAVYGHYATLALDGETGERIWAFARVGGRDAFVADYGARALSETEMTDG